MLVMDVHHELRNLETDLRYQVSGRVRTRGGSAGNTARCLERIPQLVSGLDYAAAQVTSKKLASWIYRSRLILGDADPVSRLPRLPGEGEPACPSAAPLDRCGSATRLAWSCASARPAGRVAGLRPAGTPASR